jgi:hypothetical protein
MSPLFRVALAEQIGDLFVAALRGYLKWRAPVVVFRPTTAEKGGPNPATLPLQEEFSVS